MLSKYWSWCGNVGRMCSSRQALMLSNWCSLQWKREGLASWRNTPVYDLAHKWKIRGAGTSHELLWEKRIDDYCNVFSGVHKVHAIGLIFVLHLKNIWILTHVVEPDKIL